MFGSKVWFVLVTEYWDAENVVGGITAGIVLLNYSRSVFCFHGIRTYYPAFSSFRFCLVISCHSLAFPVLNVMEEYIYNIAFFFSF